MLMAVFSSKLPYLSILLLLHVINTEVGDDTPFIIIVCLECLECLELQATRPPVFRCDRTPSGLESSTPCALCPVPCAEQQTLASGHLTLEPSEIPQVGHNP